MPKTAKPKTPGSVLQKYIDDYQTNPFALSKSLNVAYQTVTHIIQGKSRITVPMALKLAQYFGNSAKFWLDLQASSEIEELSNDKKFIAEIKKIPKASDVKTSKKTTGKTKIKSKAKAGKRKTKTLAEKRKKASKVPGSKKARSGKPKKK